MCMVYTMNANETRTTVHTVHVPSTRGIVRISGDPAAGYARHAGVGHPCPRSLSVEFGTASGSRVTCVPQHPRCWTASGV